MPAFNSKIKEIQFLGLNIWFFGALASSIIITISIVILAMRANYTLAFLLLIFDVISIIATLILFRYNNNLFELNFLLASKDAKSCHVTWLSNKDFES